MLEITEMQESMAHLRQQLNSLMSNKNSSADSTITINSSEETFQDENVPTSVGLNTIFNSGSCKKCNCDAFTKPQLLAQVGI